MLVSFFHFYFYGINNLKNTKKQKMTDWSHSHHSLLGHVLTCNSWPFQPEKGSGPEQGTQFIYIYEFISSMLNVLQGRAFYIRTPYTESLS